MTSKLVIFDMDGTIIDSREIVLGAFKHVLEEFGVDYDEQAISAHVGRLLDHTYQDLLPGQDIKRVTDLHRRWQADNKHLLKGYNGLPDFLEALKKRGSRLAIFTSATRPRADLALDGLGIREYFDATICGDEVEQPKPHQEGIIALAGQTGTALEDVIMVGDAAPDIISGKSAGVVTIGVTHGFGSQEALEAAGADYIVSDLAGIDKQLKELGA